MRKLLRSAMVGTAVGAIGLTACDASSPPSVVLSPPVASETIPPGKTLADLVRDSLADIARDADAYSRARRLGALLPTLGPEQVPAVKQTLEDQTIDLDGAEIELLVRYWATHQPEEASRWALKDANTTFRAAAVSTALLVWAEADPKAAMSVAWPWLDDYPDVSSEMERALVRGWFAHGDSPELRRFIHDLDMGILRQRAIGTYVRALMQTQGAEALFRWADSLPDQDDVYKLAVYRQAVGTLQRFDQEAALRWCAAHCDGPYGKNVRNILAGRWARRDAPAALVWLSSQPAGYETNLAVKTTFAEWSARDREAALAWMAGHTNGGPAAPLAPWLEQIVPVYALKLSEVAPADAIQWAQRVEPAADREWVLIQVARAWRRVDEASAEAWLLQSPLSEDAREKARLPGRNVRATGAESPPQN